MSTRHGRPGENDFALDPLRDAVEFAQDAWRDDPSCDRLLLEIGAAAQHAREVARDTMEGDRTSPFYTDDEESFLSLANSAVEDLNEEIEDRGCAEGFHVSGMPDTQLEVFNNGWEAGSVPLATGGLDNISRWAEANMSEEQQRELEETRAAAESDFEWGPAGAGAGDGGPGRATIHDEREFLEIANDLIRELNEEDGCANLFDIADEVTWLVGEFARAAVRGDVDPDQTGGGTAPAEVANAWVIMHRQLARSDCISDEAKQALRDINPMDDVRERRTQDVEGDIETARFLLAVAEGAEEGQTVTCSRIQEGKDIRKGLLEAASQGNVDAAALGGEHRMGGQILCAVLTQEMED